MENIKKYISSIISAIIIISVFFIAPILIFYVKCLPYEIHTIFKELYPAITAIGGLLFVIPIRLFWLSYMKPVLELKNEIESRSFHPIGGSLEYVCNRIIVENTGRSAAKNCKGYIVITGKAKERVCWTIPDERPNATINAKDEERLDFCAFLNNYHSGTGTEKPPRIIAPIENGWDNHRDLSTLKECEVLITAENADPVSKKIRFNFDKREVEFIT
ncbi:MAG: hypothetical protein AAB333_02790 [Pseudomonadota bacterium]